MAQTRHEAAIAEAVAQQEHVIANLSGAYEFGGHDTDTAGAHARRGLDEGVVRAISAAKKEPEWMLKRRLRALRLFEKRPMPTWGADLSGINFDDFKYFVRATDRQVTDCNDLPPEIKNPYDRLGIPEA